MTNQNSDPGIKAVGKIFRDLNIDTEWSQVFERGFVWWGHHYAQRVWADEPFEEDGLHISKVHAEMEFLRYPERSTFAEDTLASGMVVASMSGQIISDETKTLSLYCNALVHEENSFWLVRLFEVALMLQHYDVEFRADQLAQELNWTSARSSHPTSGPRAEMDEELNLVGGVIVNEGEKPFDTIKPKVFQDLASNLSDSGLITTSDPDGLTSYVPFGSETSLFRATTREEHPVLGKGLLLSLSLPPEDISEKYDINGAMIMELNRLEKETSQTAHFLGSWCLSRGRGENETTPAFVTFIPAMVCDQNVFTNMLFSTLNHCRWAGEALFESDFQNKTSGVQEESEAAKERNRLSTWLKKQREEQAKL